MQGFGPLTLYLADPDHLGMNSLEKPIKCQSKICINNASEIRIREWRRYIVRTMFIEQWKIYPKFEGSESLALSGLLPLIWQ